MVEICRIHSAALRHPTYGVNAQLATIPMYPEDPALPTIARVLDVTEDPEVIRGVRPLDFPALIVSLQSPIDAEREFGDVLRDNLAAQVFIDIVVGAQDPAPSARDTLYYIRAILRCLKDMMSPENEADVFVHGIRLVAMNKVQWGPMNLELPTGKIVGTVVPDYLIRDTLP